LSQWLQGRGKVSIPASALESTVYHPQSANIFIKLRLLLEQELKMPAQWAKHIPCSDHNFWLLAVKKEFLSIDSKITDCRNINKGC